MTVIITLAVMKLSELLGVMNVQMINHLGYEHKVSSFGKSDDQTRAFCDYKSVPDLLYIQSF